MSQPPRPSITVVIPVHNEATFLPGALPQLFEVMSKVEADIKVVVAENGSTDETAALVRTAMASYPTLSLLELPEPDYGAAMRAGFLSADTDWVVNFDID
jgi:glycosyltransferase involved in cell wall biosynthesis